MLVYQAEEGREKTPTAASGLTEGIAHLAPLHVRDVAVLQRVQREGAQAVGVGGQQRAAAAAERHRPHLAPPLGAVHADAAVEGREGLGLWPAAAGPAHRNRAGPRQRQPPLAPPHLGAAPSRSHTRSVLSAEQDTNRRSSGWQAMPVTAPVWLPDRLCRQRPAVPPATSHTRSPPAASPDSSSSPSGVQRSWVSSPWWPRSVCSACRGERAGGGGTSRCHSLTLLSAPPVARISSCGM